jgi:hypothetical protein
LANSRGSAAQLGRLEAVFIDSRFSRAKPTSRSMCELLQVSFQNEVVPNAAFMRAGGWVGLIGSMENVFRNQPAYYVMRTLSTALEAVTPSDFDVFFSSSAGTFEVFKFALPNGDRLLSVCLTGRSKDVSEEVATALTVPLGEISWQNK